MTARIPKMVLASLSKSGAAICLIMVTVTSADAQSDSRYPVSVSSSALSTSQEEAIESFALNALASANLTPGFALAIVREGAIVYEAGFGYADVAERRPTSAETLYYTASLTKAITAATVVQLAEDERLSLDSTLPTYWPDLNADPSGRYPEMRIRDLLSHSGTAANGAVNFVTTWIGPYRSDGELTRVLLEFSEPQDGFEYANSNYALISYIITKAANQPWQRTMDEVVFDRLGMNASTAYYSQSPLDALARPYLALQERFELLPFPKTDETITGAGGILSTAHDLAQFVAAQLNGGRVSGSRGFSPDVPSLMQEPTVRVSDEWFEFERYAYGLGLYLSDYGPYTLVHHFGGISGYRSHMSWMPDAEIGVVVLQNTSEQESLFSDVVATFVYDMLLGRQDYLSMAATRLESVIEAASTAQATRSTLSERQTVWEQAGTATLPLDAYAGTYFNDRLGAPRIRMDSGQLMLEWGAWRTPVYPAGDHQFVVPVPDGGGESIRWVFQANGDDGVTALNWDGRIFLKR